MDTIILIHKIEDLLNLVYRIINNCLSQEEMGVRQSVHIETPNLQLEEWEYVADDSQIPEEYGMFRTLRNKKTGEKIDEYDFIWPNEEEYHYYLKSFNWRYKQPNVVNTRYIILNNHE